MGGRPQGGRAGWRETPGAFVNAIAHSDFRYIESIALRLGQLRACEIRTLGRRGIGAAAPGTAPVLQRQDNRDVRPPGTTPRRGTRLSSLDEVSSSTFHQFVDPVRDPLCGLAKLLDRPIGRISLRDVVGAGVVHQPLGQRARQQQLPLFFCRHPGQALPERNPNTRSLT